MNFIPSSRSLALLIAALCFWLVASAFAVLWRGGDTIIIALSLLAFTAILSSLGRGRFSGWFAAALSIVLFTAVQIGLLGVTQDALIQIAILSVLLLVTAVLGMAIARNLNLFDRLSEQQKKLIEELRAYETETGLLRTNFMQTALRTEIIRSQRFKKNLSVLLMDIENAEQIEKDFGKTGIDENRRQLAEILSNSLRAIDIPFGGAKLGAILPETGSEGASVVANRLVSKAQEQSRLGINIGLAEFPKDGLTEKELLHAAESAYQHAKENNEGVVFFSRLEKSERGL